MKLHRVYERGPNGERAGEKLSNGVRLRPKLLGVEVVHTGTDAEQHFAPDLVDRAIDEGWMTFDGETLVLHTYGGEDLKYRVRRVPGCYCLHCNAKLEYEPPGAPKAGTIARAHVAALHAGKASPQPKRWSSGYEVIHFYDCVLDAKQHAQFKAGVTSG